jgi:16S rRNA A1518/A1519 N6-dimethyltransferase RsmA/KsgA/DIM1 with predicted DNA glycosylase/AP lyase activity
MNIISSLKDENQDFEFYPTTQEIIEKVKADIKDPAGDERYYCLDRNSLLDIGAGNGKVLSALRECCNGDLYAIEKSELLRNRLLGTKNVYWEELTSRMSEITNRLITKRRNNLKPGG